MPPPDKQQTDEDQHRPSKPDSLPLLLSNSQSLQSSHLSPIIERHEDDFYQCLSKTPTSNAANYSFVSKPSGEHCLSTSDSAHLIDSFSLFSGGQMSRFAKPSPNDVEERGNNLIERRLHYNLTEPSSFIDGNEVEDNGGIYESYNVDYDNDYDHYYDKSIHYLAEDDGRISSRGRFGVDSGLNDELALGEDVDDEEDVFDEFITVSGDHLRQHHMNSYLYQQQQSDSDQPHLLMSQYQSELDFVTDADTYGLMLPASYHSYQQRHEQQQQSQQHKHLLTSMYGNPFAYNLHTIVEESENESSLHTLSSLTSSTLQTSCYEPYEGNCHSIASSKTSTSPMTTENDTVSSPSGETETEFSIVHHTHVQQLKRKTNKSNFDAKQHQTSSSYGDNIDNNIHINSIEDDEYEEEEDGRMRGTHSMFINSNQQDNHYHNHHHHHRHEEEDDDDYENIESRSNNRSFNFEKLSSSSSKLERYFTSSLLEANTKTKTNIDRDLAKMDEQIHHQTRLPQTNDQPEPLLSSSKVKTLSSPRLPLNRTQRSLNSTSVQMYRLIHQLFHLSSQDGKHFDKFFTLLQLISQHYHLDMFQLLKFITIDLDSKSDIDSSRTETCTKLVGLFRRKSTYFVRVHLHNLFVAIQSGILVRHLVANSRLACWSRHNNNSYKHLYSDSQQSVKLVKLSTVDCTENKGSLSLSSVKVIINRSVRVANPTCITSTIPSNSSAETSPEYRTVLQINDQPGGSAVDSNHQKIPLENQSSPKTTNKTQRIASKFSKLSNPLNRDFLAKLKSNTNDESQEDPTIREFSSEKQNYSVANQEATVISHDYSTGKEEPTKLPIRNQSGSLIALGSLRSRAEPTEEVSRKLNKNVAKSHGQFKFRTISNIGSRSRDRAQSSYQGDIHQRVTKSDSVQPPSAVKSDNVRSKSHSKSFRVVQSKSSSSQCSQTSKDSTAKLSTWESLYEIFAKRNPFKSKSKKASKAEDESSQHKSFSEPNLVEKKSKSTMSAVSLANTRNRSEHSYKSTPALLTENEPKLDDEVNRFETDQADSALLIHDRSKSNSVHQLRSTPSLLYRLSSNNMVKQDSPFSRQSGSIGGGRKYHRPADALDCDTSLWTGSLDKRRTMTHNTGPVSLRQFGSSSSRQTQTNEDQWHNLHTRPQTHQASIRSNKSSVSADWSVPKLQRSLSGSNHVFRSSGPVMSNTNSTSLIERQIDPLRSSSNYSSQRSKNFDSSTESDCIRCVEQPTSHSTVFSKIGEICLTMEYLSNHQSLQIDIHQCRLRHLVKNKTDLYVKAYLVPPLSKQANKRKTKVKRAIKVSPDGDSGLSSTHYELSLNETLSFDVEQSAQLEMRRLLVGVWNRDTFGRNGLLAQTSVELHDRSRQAKWYSLTSLPSVTSELVNTPPPVVSGNIFLALKYEPISSEVDADRTTSNHAGQLHILVKEAQNLNLLPLTGNGEIYFKISLLPARSKDDRVKSLPVKWTVNPRWNQTVVFANLTRCDLQTHQVQITIWRQDKLTPGGSKCSIGGVRLSSSDNDSWPEETTLWKQLLERPNNMWAYGEIALRDIDQR